MVMKMEFRELPVDSLISAEYNLRKKLKPGDSEFEKIKNSIKQKPESDCFDRVSYKEENLQLTLR